MQLFIQIAPLLVLLVVAFGCGYGVREYIARRRRAAVRKIFHENIPSLGRPEKSPDIRNHGKVTRRRRRNGELGLQKAAASWRYAYPGYGWRHCNCDRPRSIYVCVLPSGDTLCSMPMT